METRLIVTAWNKEIQQWIAYVPTMHLTAFGEDRDEAIDNAKATAAGLIAKTSPEELARYLPRWSEHTYHFVMIPGDYKEDD